MAAQNRRPVFNVKDDLLNNGHRFSFIQAERLLRYRLAKSQGEKPDEEALAKAVRVRPQLSLGFPQTDIASISESPNNPDHFLITATFLGLYGVSSPLPTFYTEDLMDEASMDDTVTRDFIDIINAPFYPLFFRCWSKYRPYIKVVEEEDASYLEKLFCLLGPGTKALRRGIPDVYGLLRYIGLFTQFPRSALGLKTLLSDALNEPNLKIIQCVPRLAVIPVDQRCHLGVSGVSLGVDSYLGREMSDRMGAFRISVGPVDANSFQRFFPDTQTFQTMAQLVHLYLDQPLEWDLEVTLADQEVKTTQLGGMRWSRLGWDTWIFSEDSLAEKAKTRFYATNEYDEA